MEGGWGRGSLKVEEGGRRGAVRWDGSDRRGGDGTTAGGERLGEAGQEAEPHPPKSNQMEKEEGGRIGWTRGAEG